VKPCPLNFPAGFYWYGGNSKGPGRSPKWVEQLLGENSTQCTVTNQNDDEDAHEVSDELTDTDESSDLMNSEDEEQSDDEEPQIYPTVNRSRDNAHYGLRQNPRQNQRYS